MAKRISISLFTLLSIFCIVYYTSKFYFEGELFFDNKMILEIGDDNKNRILYGNEWLIEINPDYINKLTSYKSKLSVVINGSKSTA